MISRAIRLLAMLSEDEIEAECERLELLLEYKKGTQEGTQKKSGLYINSIEAAKNLERERGLEPPALSLGSESRGNKSEQN